MVFISGDVFGNTLSVGKIYLFKSKKLVKTSKPHYFIVISTTSELIMFTCCTTKFEKRANFIESNNIPKTTLVWIKPDNDNCLPEDSFVDCNSFFQYNRTELVQMYNRNEIQFIGYLQESKIEEIRQGIYDSPLIVDEIKEIIKFF